MAENRYGGTCGCGAFVPPGMGTVARSGGRWVVSCGAGFGCRAPAPAAPAGFDVEAAEVAEVLAAMSEEEALEAAGIFPPGDERWDGEEPPPLWADEAEILESELRANGIPGY